MITFKIVLTIFWICTVVFLIGWIAYEMVYAPFIDDDNNIVENLKKMNQKDKKSKTILRNKHDRDPEWDKLK
jgi:hypothetical protein